MIGSYNLFALGNYKFKVLNLAFASVFFLMDLLVYLFNLDRFFTSRLDIHVYLHFMVLVSLVSVVASRQKIDDELSQKIRYAVNKVTINLMVGIAAVILNVMTVFGNASIPIIGVFYFLEGILIFNILFTWYGIRYNPVWLFREPTSPSSYNRMMLRLYIAIIICLLVILVLSFFPE